ncbi:MAG TPA: endonuclease/exonuclease/phosphatase family protein [Phycisphaerae bacterium]|nr:endonuclease/exonuclease/phosphatase family protein [Phycisphaerae bacterium]
MVRSFRLYAWLVGLGVLACISQIAHGYDPSVGDFSKVDPLDIRLVAYNVEGNFISDPSRDAAFARVLQALSPDIIVFEEIASDAAEAGLPSRLNAVLPYGTWEIHGGQPSIIRTVVASRFPLTMQLQDTVPFSSTRGVTIALADLPDDTYPVDVYLMGVHLKCCNSEGTEDALRQRSADAIASWMGDARMPGGNITLAPQTPMIVLGDFNLVGGPGPENTLITGDIFDNVTFGPDVKGDWDNTNVTDLMPRDPFTLDADTWPSGTTNPSSRLDRFIYTDNAVGPGAFFVFNTVTMNGSQLAAAGVQANDTSPNITGDHLPIVMDLRLFIDCNDNGIADPNDIATGTSNDCNGNGVPDECDIAGGHSPDANEDGIPDECITGADCNNNGIDDAVDLFTQESDDCNNNNVPDECDIAEGTSHDCNNTGVPDECGEGIDCNGNGWLDVCDLSLGFSTDCNASGVPDDCELDVTTFSVNSGQLIPIGFIAPQEFDIASAPIAFSDVKIDIDSFADYGQANEYITVFLNGNMIDNLFGDAAQCAPEQRSLTIPKATFNSIVGGASANFDFVGSSAVNAGQCGGFNYVDVTVSYLVEGENDCNKNMLPDECDTVTMGDFDADGAMTLNDYKAYTNCFEGPGLAPNPNISNCAQALCLTAFDLNSDGDVDLMDFWMWQPMLSATP